MPFPDELVHGVTIVEYRPEWPSEFMHVADDLRSVLGRLALTIDHIGSTSVPGLPAKDCIDSQVRVRSVADQQLVSLLEAGGYRCRPESWNHVEICDGQRYSKLAFAPPIGARRCNVHVRENGPSARYALLFRDYLRADDRARRGWGDFKKRLAQSVPDIFDYGQIKAPATDVLMAAAERWAVQTDWSVPRGIG